MRRCGCDRLGPRLLVIRDNRYRLARCFRLVLRLDRGLFQDLDLAVDAQDFRHLLFELGVAAFKMVTHLMRLDFLLTENLAHRALDKISETSVSRPPPLLPRMPPQKTRPPQLVRLPPI